MREGFRRGFGALAAGVAKGGTEAGGGGEAFAAREVELRAGGWWEEFNARRFLGGVAPRGATSAEHAPPERCFSSGRPSTTWQNGAQVSDGPPLGPPAACRRPGEKNIEQTNGYEYS